GWSMPFSHATLPDDWVALLRVGGALEPCGVGLRSRVRFSSLGDADLMMHSAYPTVEADAVFFGPDTFRFVRLLRDRVASARTCVDVGCGSGAGGLALRDRVEQVIMADINPQALRFATINAALAGCTQARIAESDVLRSVAAPVDLVVANPPYIVDPGARLYRNGGGSRGTGLAERIVREGLDRLGSGGRLVLYTGVPIVAGRDVLRAALAPLLAAKGARYTYEELDPDVFGEELEGDAYGDVERIAVVGLDARLP
ncbi:MAG TPA: class I SAM-dependent methyltransferase, partial [Myxococcota bacterium]|nr:class I SAM-dependent methyltransferase [Myxococcota bacterium]